MLKSILVTLGPLRVALAVSTLLVILAAPFAEVSSELVTGWALWPRMIAEVSSELVTGWALWPRMIAPALMPILAFVLPLDITMSRLIMLDKPPEQRSRYRFIIWCELIQLVLLLLAWLPFLKELFGA